MTRVDQILDLTPDGLQWREYFLWKELRQAVDQDSRLDPEKLSKARNDLLAVFNRLADDYDGLERKEIQSLRSEVRFHVRQINAVLVRRGEPEASARRDRLETLIRNSRWTATAQSEYAQHLRWLDDHLQPPPATAIRSDGFNLTTAISANFIRQATLTPVSDPTDVNECIVGTRVIGSGVTSGAGWLTPVPSKIGARLVANFQGVLRSDTVGYNGPVRIYSDGQTRLTGTALLEMDQLGIRRISSQVDATADSQTKGISTKFNGLLDRVVKKVARKKIKESKSQANRESSYKARQSFTERFEEDIRQQVNEGQASFLKYLRLPLMRRDLSPANWNWTSSDASLSTAVGFDGRNRPLCLVRTPHAISSIQHSIQIAIHQSFVDNTVEGYLGGRLQSLSSVLPVPDAKQDETTDAIAIRLDDFQPVRSVFDQNKLTFYLLAKQIIAEGNEYPGVIIKVSYRIIKSIDGNGLTNVKLIKDTAPSIEPIPTFSRKPRFGFGASAIRVTVEPLLAEELPQEIPLTLPTIDGDAPNVVRNLRIVDMHSSGGWLIVSLD